MVFALLIIFAIFVCYKSQLMYFFEKQGINKKKALVPFYGKYIMCKLCTKMAIHHSNDTYHTHYIFIWNDHSISDNVVFICPLWKHYKNNSGAVVICVIFHGNGNGNSNIPVWTDSVLHMEETWKAVWKEKRICTYNDCATTLWIKQN